MRKISFLIACSLVLMFGLVGCNNSTKKANKDSYNEDQYIEVQKRVGKEYENNYKDFRKITDENQVHKVKEILNELKWEYIIRDTLQPPDYQFSIRYKNTKIKCAPELYKIWIMPGKERLLLGTVKDQYAQLTKEQSETLFEIITGDKLSKLK